MTNADSLPAETSRLRAFIPALWFALISSIYFADIFLRASRKCFWADELFTVYLCRLPNFSSIWAAVTHGTDFNPPLFYLLTIGAQRLFGEGLIATRLPAIIGFWVFCVCLFVFVRRRAGAVAGAIAATFPFFTVAQYYAYEARPHGITLAWCGLALVCWQRVEERRGTPLWAVGFGLSLICALLTHVYAIYLIFPFGVVELYNLWKSRRPNWHIVAAVILSLALVVPIYLPLFRAYRSMISKGVVLFAPQDFLERFFLMVMGPELPVLLLAIAMFAAGWKRGSEKETGVVSIPRREVLLAVAFGFLPLVGIFGARITRGPFFNRYFLACIAGYAVLFAFAAFVRLPKSWAAGLAVFMSFLLLGDFGTAVFHWARHSDFTLVEPVSKFAFSPTAGNPMARKMTIASIKGDQNILVLDQLDYIYLFRYAPPPAVSHLYYGAPTKDYFVASYERLAKWAHLDVKTATFDNFFLNNKDFYVYGGSSSEPCGECIEVFLNAGYTLRSTRKDEDGLLYEYAR
ncbi:MAG: glycosyltransferase family 39 protein [Acidobacteriaceae bacterium]